MHVSDVSNPGKKLYGGGLPERLREPVGSMRCSWFTKEEHGHAACVGMVGLDGEEEVVVAIDVVSRVCHLELLSAEARDALCARLPDLVHFIQNYTPPSQRA